jgi:hypothetical protein
MGNDLRIALRSLVRSPAFLVTAVASLAIAIGATVAAFAVIDAVRLRALPFVNADRLVIIRRARKRDCAAMPRLVQRLVRDIRAGPSDAPVPVRRRRRRDHQWRQVTHAQRRSRSRHRRRRHA